MINLSRNNMLLLIPIKLCNTLQRHIIALSGATRENDFLALSSYCLGHMLTGQLDGIFGLPTESMTL